MQKAVRWSRKKSWLRRKRSNSMLNGSPLTDQAKRCNLRKLICWRKSWKITKICFKSRGKFNMNRSKVMRDTGSRKNTSSRLSSLRIRSRLSMAPLGNLKLLSRSLKLSVALEQSLLLQLSIKKRWSSNNFMTSFRKNQKVWTFQDVKKFRMGLTTLFQNQRYLNLTSLKLLVKVLITPNS